MTSAATTLPPQVTSVPAARRFVCETLVAWHLPGACDAAEMLVSELATNAVLHARTTFTVEVVLDGNAVVVRVADGSAAPARPRSYGTDSTTGRGLRLIATLAVRWGVDPRNPGKAVWFEVPADGDAASSYEPWEDDLDVDALLAQFDDEDPGAQASSRTHLAA